MPGASCEPPKDSAFNPDLAVPTGRLRVPPGPLMDTLFILVAVLVPIAFTAAMLFGMWKGVLAPLFRNRESRSESSRSGQCAARVRHVEQSGMTVEMAGGFVPC
ncbi:MAG: hypothetical protein R3F14_02790 [Polyangiaceae bacterium]